MKRLWLPSSARPEPGDRVRECRVCGVRFPWDQREQFGRHVVRCAEKNEEVIEEHLAMTEETPLTSISDKEAFAWGRKREAEGKRGFRGGLPA